MQYLGGKSRIAKELATRLRELAGDDTIIDAFVGGASVIERLTGHRRASDNHPGLIAMYQALQSGWDPPNELSRETYNTLRAAADWTNPLTAFAAFGCSYGGKEWGGYAGARLAPVAGGTRSYSYASTAARSLRRLRPKIGGVEFECMDYSAVRAGFVYCDIPYEGTTGYRKPFNHARFWRWAEKRASIAVTSRVAPPNWRSVWSFDMIQYLGKRHSVTEHLWVR